MGKGLVGFRHAVRIIFTLHGGALPVIAVQQFGGHSLFHSLFTALARKLYNPTERESGPRGGRDFDRHLAALQAQVFREPTDTQARFLYGVVLTSSGDLEAAVSHLSRVLHQDPRDTMAYLLRDAALRALHTEPLRPGEVMVPESP